MAEGINLPVPDGDSLIQTIGKITNLYMLDVSKFTDNRSHIYQALSAGKFVIISDRSYQPYLYPSLDAAGGSHLKYIKVGHVPYSHSVTRP